MVISASIACFIWSVVTLVVISVLTVIIRTIFKVTARACVLIKLKPAISWIPLIRVALLIKLTVIQIMIISRSPGAVLWCCVVIFPSIFLLRLLNVFLVGTITF